MSNLIAQPHTERAHAKLAPSSAARWINCPGSIRETEGVVETSSAYANEGTAAHELANHCLEQNVDPSASLGHMIDIRAKDHRIRQSGIEPDGKYVWPVTDEMVESVGLYVDHVKGLVEKAGALAIIDVEQRLDMRHLHPGIFGTGDAVVYDIEGEHLHVCDFKYGKGHIVEVRNNPQLGLYGAGAARRYSKYRLKQITLHVVQPRTQGEPIKSWETDLLELMEFEEDIKKWAIATDAPDAPLVAGEWCSGNFCPIRATCAVRRQTVMAAAQAEFDDVGELVLPAISKLTPEQRGTILRQADQIFGFVKAVQEAEHANALAGNPPAGFKLVAKRANRAWKLGEDDVVAHIKSDLGGGYDMRNLYTEPKLLSPAQVEKVIGKKEFAAIEKDLVIKKSSGVNLVPETDPRPAAAVDALSEFSDVPLIEN